MVVMAVMSSRRVRRFAAPMLWMIRGASRTATQGTVFSIRHFCRGCSWKFVDGENDAQH